jgi:hypothetical protein
VGGAGPSSTTSTQKFQPPAWATPYISNYLNELGILDNPFSGTQVPQQQIAGLSSLQNAGLGTLGPASQAAGALGGQATGAAGQILSGKYLDPSTNPYLKKYYDQAAQQVTNQYQMGTAPNITANAVRQGGLGGSGQNQSEQYAKWNLGNDLSGLAAKIYEPAYAQGLNQMTSVLGQTPGLMSAQYTPAQEMMQGGALQQDQQQNVLNNQYRNQMNQFQFPYTQLGQYGSGVASMAGLGGSQVNVSPNSFGTMK